MTTLGVTDKVDGLSPGWDWKGDYVSELASGEGYERFTQGSLTPDSTLIFAGPARFTAISGDQKSLHPIGLIDSMNMSSQASLQPLYEIGSNRTFFTRGKTQNQVQISAMLADHASLMKALSEEAYNADTAQTKNGDGYHLNSKGTKAPGYGELFMNLDSEAMAIPFGMLMLFKTKGSEDGTLNGKVIGATYLENCMLSGFQFQLAAQSPIMQENVQIMFDRAVPVNLT